MAYTITIYGKTGAISRVLHVEHEDEAIARVNKAVSHGRTATYHLLKPWDHWKYILDSFHIDVNTIEDMDRAFRLDMGETSWVDGNYTLYQHPDYITYPELTKAQKEILMELGFDWDRVGRIGRYNRLLSRDEVLSVLNNELKVRST